MNGQTSRESVEVRRWLAEHFEQVLNVEDYQGFKYKSNLRFLDDSVGIIELKSNIDRGSERGIE